MPFANLSSSGPAIAALLQESALLQGSFDGLLIGYCEVKQEIIVHDTADDFTIDHLEAHLTAFCCMSGLGSFYNAAGEIDAEELSIAAERFEGNLLGWFVHHHGPRRMPSMRERRITAALAGCLPGDQPVLFGIMSSSLDEDGATISFQQQIYEQEPGSLVLQPIHFSIENIGSSQRSRDYRPLRPAAGMMPISALYNGAALKQDAASVKQALAASLGSHTEGLEALYKDMLQQIQEAAQKLREEQKLLWDLQQEVDALQLAIGI